MDKRKGAGGVKVVGVPAGNPMSRLGSPTPTRMVRANQVNQYRDVGKFSTLLRTWKIVVQATPVGAYWLVDSHPKSLIRSHVPQ